MTGVRLLRHRDHPGLDDLAVYRRHGGFEAFRKALTGLTPEQAMQEVKASGLRGRGGAGFPTGQKWSFLPPDVLPRYVVANADESEPGTFKDRELLERNPFQFLEGLMIAAYACRAQLAFVYLRGEFADLARQMERRVHELHEAGLLGERILGSDFALEIRLHLGAGAYICGEESALLESLEGRRGQPRLKPPFPVQRGLYGQPTVINNVETLANVPPIILDGSAAYRSLGTEKSPGTKIFSLSGSVRWPGNYELPLGTPFRALIEDCGGGASDGRRLVGFLPSGASSCMLPASDAVLDSPMDYERVAELGSSLGSGSVIVFDDAVDPVWLAWKTIRFFEHESCGKCTPCRAGLRLLRQQLDDLLDRDSPPPDLERLRSLAAVVQRGSFCALGQAAPNALLSGMRLFPQAFEQRMGGRS